MRLPLLGFVARASEYIDVTRTSFEELEAHMNFLESVAPGASQIYDWTN